MGTVYKAVDTALDRMVAIKVLSSDLAGNPELVQRFRAEARAQANLNHTNLATLYAFIVQDDRACMVMEFVDGETFEQIILRRGGLPIDDALPLFKQALLGIGYAHRAGIVHRDIKPSNLMVNRAGIVKVMDFGIAKVMGQRGATRTGVQMGTGWYMSPEQVLNRPVDFRSDIYSLGVTLYQMITAHVPFDAPSDYQIMADQVNTPPPLPTSFAPHIPTGVENAVLKALEKNPDARFQTVEEFGVALEHPNDFGAAPPVVVVPAHHGAAVVLAPAANLGPANVAPATIPVAVSTPNPTPLATLGAFFARPERKVMAGGAALAIILLGGWLVVRSKGTEPTQNYLTPVPPSNSSAPPLGSGGATSGTASEMSSTSAQATKPAQKQRAAHQSTPNQSTAVPVPQPVSNPVRAAAVTPQIAFDVVPASIPRGRTAKLRWNVVNAQSVQIVPEPGVLPQTSGEFMVTPSETTRYTLKATSNVGSVFIATATVQVTEPARPAAQQPIAQPAQPATQPARAALVIMVRHDHGFAPAFWPQCWGLLQVNGNHLQFRVTGTNDGRRDDFDILLSQVQEVRVNRMAIRNFPAFHITIGGKAFNFIPQGMVPVQAVAAIQQKISGQ